MVICSANRGNWIAGCSLCPYYLSPSDPVPRFFYLLLAFMGSMLGVVLSGNVLQLAFFWELTSLFSFLLIGYWNQRKDAQRGARMALTVTGMGGCASSPGCWCSAPSRAATSWTRPRHTPNKLHPLYRVALCLISCRRVHQERPVPLPFLAPERDGGTDAGVGVSALGDHGKGRCVYPYPFVARFGGNRPLALVRGRCRPDNVCAWRVFRNFSAGSEGPPRLLDDQPSRITTLLIGLDLPLALIAAIFHVVNHATFKGIAVHGRRHC